MCWNFFVLRLRSLSQLEADLKVAPVEHFTEDDNVIELLACQVAEREP